MDRSCLAQPLAARPDQVAASQPRRVLGAHGVQVHVLGTTGRQPPRFHVLEQRGYRGGAVGRGAKAYGLLEATGGRLGDAVLVAAVASNPGTLPAGRSNPTKASAGPGPAPCSSFSCPSPPRSSEQEPSCTCA